MTQHPAPHRTGLTLRVHQAAPATYVIEVAGDLDHRTTDQLDAVIHHALAAKAVAVLVDLGPTILLDSSGLNSLVAAHHAAVRAHARLALIAPSTTVHRMLSTTGIDQVLPAFPTVAAALA
ncbi:STAS domain-containing protein [Streptomyces sp. NPDC004009]